MDAGIQPPSPESVTVHIDGTAATVTLNDSANGNGMNPFTSEAMLSDALRALSRDRSVRAIVVQATGPDFSVFAPHHNGATAKYPADLDASRLELLAHGYSYGVLWEALAEVNKPMIAAVRGRCEGGGLGLALACDTLVLGQSARMRCTDIENGRSPFSPMTRTLALAVGKHRTMELVLLGRPFGPKEAIDFGLANSIVEDDECEQTALRLAHEICERAPVAVSLARRLMIKSAAEMRDYDLTRSLAYHSISAPTGRQSR